MRLPRSYRNAECDILEQLKFAEFQCVEPHIEGFVDGDSNLLQIHSHSVIVEDADPYSGLPESFLHSAVSVRRRMSVCLA